MRSGLYEHLVTSELDGDIADLPSERLKLHSLEPADAHEALNRHLGELLGRALRGVGGSDAQGIARQVVLANRLIRTLGELAPEIIDADAAAVVAPAQQLLAVAEPAGVPDAERFPERPTVPLSTSALLVNGRGQPRIGFEVVRELASADHADLLCAFIKWHGLRVLEAAITRLRDRGGRLRVITTTYMGATDQRALDRLVELGADVKVSYETRTTRLHAKAWLFHRGTGLSTAYVGS